MARASWSASPTELLVARPGFSLRTVVTSSTPGFNGGKPAAVLELRRGANRLATLQEQLFAESRFGGSRAVLLILQAMDTAGKGGVIEHVVGGASPAGVKVYGFKKPTAQELSHNFLWRVRKQLPPPGFIGVFDRSHYEDVLIARVRALAEPALIEARYGQIVRFEGAVAAAGTTVIKVMLHISPEEQKRRLAARLADPDKYWKYNPGDLDERSLWPAYQEAYQLAIERTSTTGAPWYVVPADHKWYARLAVQRLLLGALDSLGLRWPQPEYDVEAERARLASS
jgi:PPK2 family polyphosphate:nucleotide phosphotransferase